MQGSISSPPIVIVQRRPDAALRALGSLAFVAVACWMVSTGRPDTMVIGILCGGYFGFTLMRWAQSFVQPGVLTISREGIEVHQAWRTVRRSWREIAGVRTVKVRLNSWIYLDRSDGGKSFMLFGWGIAADRLAELLIQARSTWSNAPELTSAPAERPQILRIETLVSPAYLTLRLASLALLLGGALLIFTAFAGLLTQPPGGQPPGALVQWDVPPSRAQIIRALAGLAIELSGAVIALGMWVKLPRRSELPPLMAIIKVASLVVWAIAGLASAIALDTLATWFLKPTYEQKSLALNVLVYGFVGLVVLINVGFLAQRLWKIRQSTE